jgi:hypothetical protein
MRKSDLVRTRTSRCRAPRARRAIAALVAAGAVAVGLQMVAAVPAQARCYEVPGTTTISYQCDINGNVFGPYGGGSGGGSTGYQEMVGIGDENYGGGGGLAPFTGETLAADLLANDRCANFVAGATSSPPTGKTAAHARIIFDVVPKTFANDYHPQSPTAYASAPVGAGSGGSITLFTPYVLVTPDDIKKILPEGTRLSHALSREEVQAAILLHETAHLTGALNHGSTLPGVDPVWNMMLLQACFGVVAQPI